MARSVLEVGWRARRAVPPHVIRDVPANRRQTACHARVRLEVAFALEGYRDLEGERGRSYRSGSHTLWTMLRPSSRSILLFAALVSVAACDQSPIEVDPPAGSELITSFQLAVNPSGAAPLGAEIQMTTSRTVSAQITVVGDGGPDITHRFDDLEGASTIPVLGLYPGRATTVRLELFGTGGELLETREQQVTGQALSSDFPEIDLEVATAEAVPGVTLVSYFGHNSDITPQRPFAFDAEGDIRWALDFRGHPELGNLFFDNGVERLANGNLYFGSNSTDKIYEVTMLGRVVRSWTMPGYGFHHNVKETSRGTFVLTAELQNAATVEDQVIEIDQATGAIVTEWDLRKLLDQRRQTWPTAFSDINVDWFHG
ncbi:aryl-sulfate sulfotransferase, partial [Rubrivirga sp.]|uniref:aryl-sulfate sulfotransferase n=1 Tax=Rubrivirga sp. TaxID=1885344 RepID=UPI003C75C46C